MGNIVKEHPKKTTALLLLFAIQLLDWLDVFGGVWSNFSSTPPFQWLQAWWLPMTIDIYWWLGLAIDLSILGMLIWIFVAIRQNRRAVAWLEKIADEDSRDMTHRVHWESGSEKTDPHLTALDPYVDLTVTLLNSSVYTLTLTKVEGKMTFHGNPLPSTAEILNTNTRHELKHAEYYQLQLRQWLQPHIAQIILTSDRAEFVPGHVAIWLTYQSQIGIPKPVRIAFGNAPFIVKESSAKDAEVARLRSQLSEREEEITKLDSKVKERLGEKDTLSVASSLSVPPLPRRLQFEFSDALIDHSNQNLIVVRVRVRNPTESTIIGVSVRIESIVEIEKTGQPNTARSYIYRKLPLMLRDDRGRPPRDNIDLHPGDEAIFDLVTLQPHGTETLLHHAIGYTDNTGWWAQRPSGALESGRYRVQLKAQGRDVPANTLSIEFENIPGEAWVRRVEEPSGLS